MGDTITRREQLEKLKPLLRQVLELMGEDPDRDGLARTPDRWAAELLSCTDGMLEDPATHLGDTLEVEHTDYPVDGLGEMIILDNIEFTSMCEHHVVPFRGRVDIGYIPDPESRALAGLSKLVRVVQMFAKRLQVQERMTQQIASVINQYLSPLGVIVVVQAVHYCLIQRDVEQRSSLALSTARRGSFLSDNNLEEKFQNYLQLRMDTKEV
ncbi:MAG: GTP cyclohydrolase I [Chloroflexi bacterium]|nr:MAG: GTP cyclohydrolase I [Chloroflexota bacterium]